MKSLIFACALPLLSSLAVAQDAAVPKDASAAAEAPAEKSEKAAPAAWLGIMLEENDGAVRVGGVMDGSPAAKAGLQSGDVILGLDKIEAPGRMAAVIESIRERSPGDTVALRFRRGESEKTVEIQLAARPNLEAEFRGAFERAETRQEPAGEADKALKKAAKEQAKLRKKLEAGAAEKKDGDRGKKEHGAEAPGEAAAKQDKERGKAPAAGKASRARELAAAREKLRAAAEESAARHRAAREEIQKHMKEFMRMQHEHGKLSAPGKPGGGPPWPLLRYYMEQQKFGAPDKTFPGGRLEMKQALPNAWQHQQDAVWKQVEQSIGRALKDSGLAPDVIEKVMQAVASARHQGGEADSRRAKLKAEAARLDKEMQALKEKAGRIREELEKSGE